MTLKADFSFPLSFWLGAGRTRELPQALQQAGISRPLVVTDSALAQSAVFARVLDALGKSDFSVFSQAQSDPDAECVRRATEAMRENNADGVLAVGGGSALDAGKAAAFMLRQTLPIWEFEDVGDNWRRASTNIPPVVAVPTTAGTGSEAGRAAVVSGPEGKKVIFHPQMLPAVAIADAELTRDLPPHLTAATGFDALAHGMEALCAPTFHPLCEGIALECLRLVHRSLPRAFSSGGDLRARSEMMAAAMMGAVAFQKGLGAVHSLSHPLGFLLKAHHGLLNAILLPYVVSRNCEADASGRTARKLARLARFLELSPATAEGVLKWLLDLRRDLGIPHSLSDAGILRADDSRLDEISRMATRDPTAATNPIPLDETECARILNSALTGKV